MLSGCRQCLEFHVDEPSILWTYLLACGDEHQSCFIAHEWAGTKSLFKRLFPNFSLCPKVRAIALMQIRLSRGNFWPGTRPNYGSLLDEVWDWRGNLGAVYGRWVTGESRCWQRCFRLLSQLRPRTYVYMPCQVGGCNAGNSWRRMLVRTSAQCSNATCFECSRSSVVEVKGLFVQTHLKSDAKPWRISVLHGRTKLSIRGGRWSQEPTRLPPWDMNALNAQVQSLCGSTRC